MTKPRPSSDEFSREIPHLKVPKCEIFDRSDFHVFFSIKPFWVGDFGAKI
jgi:hypothetical protein